MRSTSNTATREEHKIHTYRGNTLDLIRDDTSRLANTTVQSHRTDARCNRSHTVVDQSLRHDGRGRSTISRLAVTLGSNFLDQPSTDVLFGILERDLPGNGHTIVDNLGSSIISLQDHVATLGPQRHSYGIGDLVDSLDEGLA